MLCFQDSPTPGCPQYLPQGSLRGNWRSFCGYPTWWYPWFPYPTRYGRGMLYVVVYRNAARLHLHLASAMCPRTALQHRSGQSQHAAPGATPRPRPKRVTTVCVTTARVTHPSCSSLCVACSRSDGHHLVAADALGLPTRRLHRRCAACRTRGRLRLWTLACSGAGAASGRHHQGVLRVDRRSRNHARVTHASRTMATAAIATRETAAIATRETARGGSGRDVASEGLVRKITSGG